MAVWYDCGNGLVATSWARAELGADAYLCCPGPSLANVDPDVLARAGIMIFALNTAYPKIRPHVWIGMDDPNCYDSRVWWEPFVKVTRMYVQNGVDLTIRGGQHIRYCPNTYFPDLQDGDAKDMFDRRAHDTAFVWNRNTFTFALHLMVWMGARRIRLVGCDFGGPTDYHDGRCLTDDQRRYNRTLYGELVDMLTHLQPTAERHGVQIISCTPDSPVNDVLGYMPLDVAIDESRRRVPAAPADERRLHCGEAEHCRWSPASAGSGVMVGCAPTQEWMIQWWWSHYSQHNTLPVAFADFGVSAPVRQWCGERGTLIDATDAPAEGWFRKPFAILRSPFTRTLWLDLDAQVLGNVDPLLALSEGDRPGLMRSTGRISPRGEWQKTVPDDLPMYCTSVIGVRHGAPMIEAWARRVATRQRDYEGDHEVLSDIIREDRTEIALLPDAYCQQHGTDPGLIVSHWGGWSGKNIIRRMIGAQSDAPRRQTA